MDMTRTFSGTLLCIFHIIQNPVLSLEIKSACPQKSKIERQISKFQNRSNIGYQQSILNYLLLCGSFVKWGFVSAENDNTQFRGQALENQTQKLAILKLTACHNYTPRRHSLEFSLFYNFCRFYFTIPMTFEKHLENTAANGMLVLSLTCMIFFT